MITAPTRINSKASSDAKIDGLNNKLDASLTAMAYPINHTGIPSTSLKMMLANLPPRTPNHLE
jgi:hypothetical protein